MKRFAPLLILAIAASPASAQEQPTGGTVASGSAGISQNATSTTIDQTSDKAVINWESFNIGAGTTTRFNQPGSDSVTLNRTMQTDPSRIFGNLSANGNVMLLNPNGVLFGPNSRVDVNGLMVSTGRMDDDDFNDGRYRVEAVGENPDAAIVNRGEITLKEGGWAALVAPRVENAGTIRAPLGRVALGSGEAFTLDLRGDGLIKFRAPLERAPGGGAALVTNTGTIDVEGGVVHLDARGVEGLVESVVNVDGVIRTSSARVEGGKVILSGGDHGVVEVRGDIAARSERAGDKGGRVVVTGERIDVKASASIDASGAGGGGDIEIGGDLQGEQTVALGETRRNAEAVRIEAGATITADALNVGDGGRIIVWADRWTAAAANLSARGGMAAGNGGFIEVSGKEHLIWRGRADRRAPNGVAGTLLLDPLNIEIVDDPGMTANFDLPLAPGFTPNNIGPSTLHVDDLLAALNDGNVTISTNVAGGEDGNITISAAIDYTGGTDHTLTLTTAGTTTGDILVNQEIGSSGGAALNLVLTADGAVTVNANIDTAGGDLSLTSDADAVGLAEAITIGAGVTLDAGMGDMSFTGGDLNIDATATLMSVDGALTIASTQHAININTAVAAAPEMRIDGIELGRITAANFDAVTFGEAAGPALTVESAGLLIFDSDLTLEGTSVVTSGASLEIAGDLAITTSVGGVLVGDIDTSGANGNIIANSDIHVTVDGDLTAGAGAVELRARADVDIGATRSVSGNGVVLASDVDGNMTGDVIIQGNVNSGAGDLDISGADLDLTGSLTANDGAPDPVRGAITIEQSNPATNLNIANGSPGAFDVDATEIGILNAAGAASLTLGRPDAATAQITTVGVNPIPPALPEDGLVFTQATTIHGDIVNTLDDATAAVDLSTTTGALEIRANNNLTTVGGIESAGALVLAADSDGSGATGVLDVQGAVSATGDIQLIAETIAAGASTITGGGDIRVQPSRADATLGVGDGATGDLELNDAFLNRIQPGATTINLGRDDSTAQTTISAHDFNAPVRITGGDLLMNAANGALSVTGGGDITLDTSGAGTGDINLRGASVDTNGGNFRLDADRNVSIGAITTDGGAATIGIGAGATLIAGDAGAPAPLSITTNGGNVAINGGSTINLRNRAMTVNAGGGELSIPDARIVNGATVSLVADDTRINSGVQATTLSLQGANATISDINVSNLNVRTSAGARLDGSVGGEGGQDAALNTNFLPPTRDNIAWTMNLYTASGLYVGPPEPIDPELSEEAVDAVTPEVSVPAGGGGGSWGGGGRGNSIGSNPASFFEGGPPTGGRVTTADGDIGGSGSVSSNLLDDAGGDVMFAELDDGDFLALRAINEDASASDAALLSGGRGGLVAEILSALDRNELTEDGAPQGPYGDPTTLIPGVLIYDPNAGVREEEIDAIRPPIFGALEGW